ncbi:hypothetical protein Bhyg_15652 [Pseudolycoriella hygida]|uniref:Uncharacterized protein n=1 Tax=Pseudolycoriella hygida TaxID=35572 RepID=A0A9Q0RV62_9DIPT|nr:hypothetical protein Bhyg_15652 [Pseudolycoriella hygida]
MTRYNDLALALQYKYDNLSERWAVRNLNNDLKKLEAFYAANRLRANPSKTEAEDIGYTNYSPTDEWSHLWTSRQVTNWSLVEDPSSKVAGFELKRRSWCQLNRIRTNHGRCNATLHKWNNSISPDCDCGLGEQTINHIVNECLKRKLAGGMRELIQVTDNAAKWLAELDIDL